MGTSTPAEISALVKLPERELLERLARVNAAAVPPGSSEWVDLIVADAPRDLVDSLNALRASRTLCAGRWSRERVDAVRKTLRDQDFDGFIVPQADPHMGEYVPARHHRLAWLTGFTGSAGLAVLHQDAAALFVDGRYTLQAGQEVDRSVIETRHFQTPPARDWLGQRLARAERIGYDPTLFSIRQVDEWRDALEKHGATFEPVPANPIDANWPDQPPEPLSPMVPHPLCHSGESLDDKCARLGKSLEADGLDAVVLNQLDAVAWLLNVRGNDVANIPVSVAYSILHKDGTADLYIDPLKRTDALLAHLAIGFRCSRSTPWPTG